MTREEAVKEIEKAFEPAFANYIITALTEGATVSDIQHRWGQAYEAGVKDGLKKEPRKGKWYRQINDYVDYYECSECGIAMGIYDVKNYCPNCGSRNEVEE